MNKAIAVVVGLIVLLLLVLFSSTYTVKYNEVAIRATFGSADEQSIITEPGLHYRLPVFIDRVTTLGRWTPGVTVRCGSTRATANWKTPSACSRSSSEPSSRAC